MKTVNDVIAKLTIKEFESSELKKILYEQANNATDMLEASQKENDALKTENGVLKAKIVELESQIKIPAEKLLAT